MHEREETKDADTETIRRAAGGSLYNGDELATPRQDSRRGQADDTDRALLGDSGEGCETEATDRQTAHEESRRLAALREIQLKPTAGRPPKPAGTGKRATAPVKASNGRPTGKKRGK